MSIDNSLDRIIGLVDDSHEAVKAKGGTTATPYLLANLPEAIGSIPEASDPVLQEKTVTPATSAQSVTPDSGYDGLSKVNVNAMPTATQATPSISVSSAGKITATSTQSAGYVTAGTKTATKNLTTQAAKTVTPTTSNQTAVASGRYTTGAVTVAGDANLVPANIVSGKSIFGVAGTATAGEDLSAEITEYGSLNDELEEVINSLPSAGGGGASVETCTVEIICQNSAYLNDIATNIVQDGSIVPYFRSQYGSELTSLIVENVLCGSSFFVRLSGISFVGVSLNNMTPYDIGMGSSTYERTLIAPTEAGVTGTVTIYEND